jgi:predicted O-methyltransferase YrrM
MEIINKEYITHYIQSLIKEADPKFESFRIECEENQVPIIHKEVGQLIRLLITLTNAGKVLELGTAAGFSSIFMSRIINNPQGLVTTIERNKSWIPVAKNNISRFNPPTPIEILQGDASEILPSLKGEYDIIFIDAAKSKYMEFFNYCIKLLRPNGLIISDNVLYKGMIATDTLVKRRQKTIVRGMRKYLEYISTEPSLETSILPIGDGLAISLKKGAQNEKA